MEKVKQISQAGHIRADTVEETTDAKSLPGGKLSEILVIVDFLIASESIVQRRRENINSDIG